MKETYEQKKNVIDQLVLMPIKAGCLFVAGIFLILVQFGFHQLGRKICHPEGDYLRKGIPTLGCKNSGEPVVEWLRHWKTQRIFDIIDWLDRMKHNSTEVFCPSTQSNTDHITVIFEEF